MNETFNSHSNSLYVLLSGVDFELDDNLLTHSL